MGSGGIAPRIPNLQVNDNLHTPADLPPGERATNIYRIGGWVGPRVGLDAVAKRK
jgi:hypothetical protein